MAWRGVQEAAVVVVVGKAAGYSGQMDTSLFGEWTPSKQPTPCGPRGTVRQRNESQVEERPQWRQDVSTKGTGRQRVGQKARRKRVRGEGPGVKRGQRQA